MTPIFRLFDPPLCLYLCRIMCDQDATPDPPKHDIEMGAEELLGHPIPGPAAERLAAIRARIASLQAQKVRLLKICTNSPGDQVLLKSLNQDLAEAKKQEREWQHQLDARN